MWVEKNKPFAYRIYMHFTQQCMYHRIYNLYIIFSFVGVNLIVTLFEDAKRARPKKEGLYILAPNKINGKPYWFQEDDFNNIWYSKKGYWCIGRIENLVGVGCGIVSSRNDVAEPQEAQYIFQAVSS